MLSVSSSEISNPPTTATPKRLLEPIGHVPPAEFEAQYYRQQSGLAIAA